jgi:hypothetical protein
MDADAAAWVVAIVGATVFGGVLHWLKRAVSQGEMMRCPENGSIAFVRVAPAVGGGTHGVAVDHCDLLAPGEKCAQRCLERYPEIAHGTRVNLHALRPFVSQ